MGQISDRTREHLGVTDIGIIAMRRMLLQLGRGHHGKAPSRPRPAMPRPTASVPGQTMIPSDADWTTHENLREAIAATY